MTKAEYLKKISEENSVFWDSPYMFRYVKRRRQKVGVVLAYKHQGEYFLGWSKCNTKLERFNRDIGINKALQRAVRFDQFLKSDFEEAAQSVRGDLQAIFDRVAYKVSREAED